SQFWVTLRRFNIDRLGSLIAGIGMLVFGLATSGARPDAGQIAAYLVLFTCSVVIYNSFLTMLMTLGIWLVRVENLWVIGEVVQDVARFPADIFASQLKQFLTFVVPFTFIGSISARQLTKGIDLPMVGIGLLWAANFFGAGRLYWQFALKHYASASS
ncbi:MAG: ABC-2 family transporter protein, partial [Chthonomonadaceae bacterium]|nr:ABC-2 family transporter protein [Chthonomonadaceae bacterium]